MSRLYVPKLTPDSCIDKENKEKSKTAVAPCMKQTSRAATKMYALIPNLNSRSDTQLPGAETSYGHYTAATNVET